jgi:vacuolar-type H+-ATPase subunit E/Vma4
MTTRPQGFVALSSLKQGHPSTDQALAEIRRMYFKTTPRTIENDLAHAVELLKGLDTEAAREKASVFMEGLAELRKEWQSQGARRKAQGPRK